MNRATILQQIRKRARADERNRKDPRFLETLGFLVAKGLLKTNVPVRLRPNKRLRVDDAVWAGQHVEPRILEVLPAAILRLGRHFDLDPERHKELAEAVASLRAGETQGKEFRGVPYAKLKHWVDLPLPDRRIKTLRDKKVPKTFRLAPQTIERLALLAREKGISETAVIESLVLG
jgi:hypothetical protein